MRCKVASLGSRTSAAKIPLTRRLPPEKSAYEAAYTTRTPWVVPNRPSFDTCGCVRDIVEVPSAARKSGANAVTSVKSVNPSTGPFGCSTTRTSPINCSPPSVLRQELVAVLTVQLTNTTCAPSGETRGLGSSYWWAVVIRKQR